MQSQKQSQSPQSTQYKTQPNKPLYVTFIDEEKFEQVQEFVFTPLVYIFLFFATGIFGSLLLLAVCFL